jgi:hypothetical protein
MGGSYERLTMVTSGSELAITSKKKSTAINEKCIKSHISLVPYDSSDNHFTYLELLILKKVHAVIPAGGHLMCCIPNAQHWSIQARLSIGEWRYESKGLLDKTHIRFFTKKTIIELLEGSGFEVLEITPRYVYHPTTEKFLDVIGNLATACGGNSEEAKEDASVFQYIFKARKN